MRPASILTVAASALLSAGTANAAAAAPFRAGLNLPFVVPRGGADADDAPSTNTSLEDMMKTAGVDSSKIDDLMKSMPGGGEGMPSVEESMAQMSEMMNSPIFQEYMNDPEKLEQSRKMILENEMMKQMMGSMPGMEDILNDPEKWRETMQAAGEMYKNMAAGGGMEGLAGMMSGMGGGAGGGMPGLDELMGGAGTLGGTEALDELSEAD
mmetsp:Transcript_4273/g.9088  ORF Transcript_4273/g.9088 Transcript_4273/m.9088 type:complete len:210 (-) Transcript_4273:66-695(-)